ncbi:MAG TPA: hypothetical protein PLR99_27905, partial [Polyangiaceae bacterium]|nr:hypothetical protein [Polyangiaceae bacterium]
RVVRVVGTVSLGLLMGLGCSTLKPGEGEPAPDASSTPPSVDDASGVDAGEPDTAAPSPADAGADAPDAARLDAADAADAPDLPGPLEPFVGNLLAGLGVSASSDHVYWLEQGARAGASSNFDAVFRRRGLTAAPCSPATDNCGAWLPTAGRTYFGDAHTGPVSSADITCFSVIYNATRDTELHCLVHGPGTMARVPGVMFAASVRLAIGNELYFSVPSRAGGPATLKRWNATTPATAPVDVLVRTATDITDVVVDGDLTFWTESSGSGASAMTSVWARQGVAGTPTQVAPPSAGGARLALDASSLYVTHLAAGTILRHPRAPGGAGAGVSIASGQASVGPILRRGAYLLWLNYGPAPDYTASEVVRANPDGSGALVIDRDETLSDLAATSDTAYMVTFGKPPDYIGTVKRVRFTR